MQWSGVESLAVQRNPGNGGHLPSRSSTRLGLNVSEGGGSQPVISVITPTKNRLKLLRETMDSVAAQSFKTWEHIIVDDGSDDGTCEEVTRRMIADSRIRYVRRTGEKSGANVCRNLGIRVSSGEFIVFLDSDDLLAPDCLGRRGEAIQA